MIYSQTFPAAKRCLCYVKASRHNVIIDEYFSQDEIAICSLGSEDLPSIVFILSTSQRQRLLRVSCKILVLGLRVNEILHAGKTEDLQS